MGAKGGNENLENNSRHLKVVLILHHLERIVAKRQSEAKRDKKEQESGKRGE
jgi:hypothetical protein